MTSFSLYSDQKVVAPSSPKYDDNVRKSTELASESRPPSAQLLIKNYRKRFYYDSRLMFAFVFLFFNFLQTWGISLQVPEIITRLSSISQTRSNTTPRSPSEKLLSCGRHRSPFSSTHGCISDRLFGNRSFCFEKMQEYTKALTDAELSLSMSPGWVKGLFRKSRALAGLQVSEMISGVWSGILPSTDDG